MECTEGAAACTDRQQLSPVGPEHVPTCSSLGRGSRSHGRRLVAMARTRTSTLGPAARPVATPDEFDDRGTPRASGIVTLPLHVRWSEPVVAYDMGIRQDRIRVYEQVLREGTEADVLHYIDPEELMRLFDELVLPLKVRQTWQQWFARHDEAIAEC